MDKERFMELFPELEEDKKEGKEHKEKQWENGEKDEKIGQEQRKREEFFDHMKMQIRPETSWNLSESWKQKEWKNRKEKKRILIYSATAAACLIFMIIFPNLSELLKMSEQNNTILISENSLDENSETNLMPDIKEQKEENSVSENIIDDDIDRDDILDHGIKNEDKLNSNISENNEKDIKNNKNNKKTQKEASNNKTIDNKIISGNTEKAENEQESIVETDHQKEDYGRPETDTKETNKKDVNSKEKPKKQDNKKENTKTDNSNNSNDTKTDNLDNNDIKDNQDNNGNIQESANTGNTENSETYVTSPDMPSAENDSGFDHIENIEETVNDNSANDTTVADSADIAEDTTVTDSAIEDNNTISITPTEDIGDIPDFDFHNALRGWWEKEQGTSAGNANDNQAEEETNIATENENILEGIENAHDITKEQIEKKLSKYPYLYYYQDGKKESWYQAEEKTQSSIEGKKFLGTALILKEKTLILDEYGNTQEIVYIYGEENDLSTVFVRFQVDGEDWFYEYKQ